MRLLPGGYFEANHTIRVQHLSYLVYRLTLVKFRYISRKFGGFSSLPHMHWLSAQHGSVLFVHFAHTVYLFFLLLYKIQWKRGCSEHYVTYLTAGGNVNYVWIVLSIVMKPLSFCDIILSFDPI